MKQDLAKTELPFLNELMISGLYLSDKKRSKEQKDALAISDTLVQEILDADILIFGTPIYNFSVPASLKAYIDLICRAGKTFKYSVDGSRGLS